VQQRCLQPVRGGDGGRDSVGGKQSLPEAFLASAEPWITEQRRRSLHVFSKQEDQPWNARLARGLVLQLGIGDFRTVPHR
jgi:hypothetical protein